MAGSEPLRALSAYVRQRLPRLKIPLAEDDPDITLDLQAAFKQVYVDGRYWRRIRYNQKCKPRLSSVDQTWADERVAEFRTGAGRIFFAVSLEV